eukprot:snap_masked-scaffold_11-processed-gene-8.18-mRNA-1 protein AED:1.00 eAED:1.00 QI:0/-1/0/0/-1/1/1/0/358
MEGTQKRKLKQTCVRCSKFKKRCDSKKPTCSRCDNAGSHCVYDLERKRGRKIKASDQIKRHKFSDFGKRLLGNFLFTGGESVEENAQPLTLRPEVESWAWKIIRSFASELETNYTQFSSQPLSNLVHLGYAAVLVSLYSFDEFEMQGNHAFSMFSNKIKLILQEKSLDPNELLKIVSSNLSFEAVQEVIETHKKDIFPQENRWEIQVFEKCTPETAKCTICSQHQGFFIGSSFQIHFETNPQFENYFGYTSDMLHAQLTTNVNCFLPFGANALGLLCDEETLEEYLDLCIYQAKDSPFTACTDSTASWYFTVPNSMIMKIKTNDSFCRRFQVSTLFKATFTGQAYAFETKLALTPCFL